MTCTACTVHVHVYMCTCVHVHVCVCNHQHLHFGGQSQLRGNGEAIERAATEGQVGGARREEQVIKHEQKEMVEGWVILLCKRSTREGRREERGVHVHVVDFMLPR